MKLTLIKGWDKVNIEINKNSGSLNIFYVDWDQQPRPKKTGVMLTYKTKTYNIEDTLFWAHYEFKNEVGYVVTELAKLNMLTNIKLTENLISCYNKQNIIEYRKIKNDSLSKLITEFEAIDDCRINRGLRFNYILTECDSLLNDDPIIELHLGCNGHYVNGSYVHDWEAAIDYVAFLNDKFNPLIFNFINCHASNSHLYTFVTKFRLSTLTENIEKIINKKATKGLCDR